MQLSKYPLILALTLAALLLPGQPAVSQAPAVKKTTIRIASLAPPGSSFVKVLKAWSRTLEKETEGRVELRLRGNGEWAELEIEDTGCGMDGSFIRE